MPPFNKVEPLVTVAIPSYNHSLYIEECVDSIINQDYKNIELIIIDDGSTDDSFKKLESLLEKCAKRFVRFELRTRGNKGLCNTLNEALDWANGDLFAPSASDDILFPYKIREQVNSYVNNVSNGVVGVLAGFSIFSEFGKVIKIEKGSDRIFGFNELFLRSIRILGPATLINTSKLREIGGYDSRFKVEDLYILLRLTEDGSKLFSMSAVLVHYRRHDGNLSSQHEVMWNSVLHILKQYETHSLYQRSLANSMMIHAHSLQVSNPLESIKWGVFVILKDWRMLFSSRFYVFVIKFILPKKLQNLIKKIYKQRGCEKTQ